MQTVIESRGLAGIAVSSSSNCPRSPLHHVGAQPTQICSWFHAVAPSISNSLRPYEAAPSIPKGPSPSLRSALDLLHAPSFPEQLCQRSKTITIMKMLALLVSTPYSCERTCEDFCGNAGKRSADHECRSRWPSEHPQKSHGVPFISVEPSHPQRCSCLHAMTPSISNALRPYETAPSMPKGPPPSLRSALDLLHAPSFPEQLCQRSKNITIMKVLALLVSIPI